MTFAMLAAGLPILCSCGSGDRPAGRKAPELAPRTVQVVAAVQRPMPIEVSVTGTLAARENSLLSAKVPGRLEELKVDIGSTVRKGDTLARIEPRDYELRLQQAEAALGQARTTLGLPAEGTDDRVDPAQATAVKQARAVLDEASSNRQRVLDLAKARIASQSEVDTAEVAFRVAQARFETALEEARTRVAALAERRAALDLAKKQLTDTSMRAPFDGIVQARPANVGEYVSAGTPVVQLVHLDPLRLRLLVPEREASLVRIGQEVWLHLEGDTNRYSGQIARLSPALNEQTRMLVVEADVPARGTLRAGFFARAQIIVDSADSGLSVPIPTITTFAGVEKVVTIRDGKALEQPITTGRRGTDWIEVRSGLRKNELVVLNPAGLRTGQPLTVDPAKGPVTNAPADGRTQAAPLANSAVLAGCHAKAR